MSPVEDRITSLLYPLTDFYAQAGTDSPRVEVLDGAAMPQPYRSLLVHTRDMTPTLEAYCGRPIHLKPLEVRQTADALYRQVLLVPDASIQPVEFGAIRIELGRFNQAAREQITGCYTPLGAILRDRCIPHSSRPTAFFTIEPDATIRQALGLVNGPWLCGRHNIISDSGGQTLAEVVEILPPLKEGDGRG
jgi:chorismate-pyruvate lyase